MAAEGNDPLTKMAISATQLTLFFAIFLRYFSSLFFSTPPDKFFSDSAGPFTELRPGAFAILAFEGQRPAPPQSTPHCTRKLNFNVIGDITPVAGISRVP